MFGKEAARSGYTMTLLQGREERWTAPHRRRVTVHTTSPTHHKTQDKDTTQTTPNARASTLGIAFFSTMLFFLRQDKETVELLGDRMWNEMNEEWAEYVYGAGISPAPFKSSLISLLLFLTLDVSPIFPLIPLCFPLLFCSFFHREFYLELRLLFQLALSLSHCSLLCSLFQFETMRFFVRDLAVCFRLSAFCTTERTSGLSRCQVSSK